MTTKTPLTRRTALALTALGTLFSLRAVAAPQRTAVERLAERLARDISEGRTLTMHFSPGPRWWSLSPEERAEATLQWLDAGKTAKRATDIDGDFDEPPRCTRGPVDLKELVRRL